MTHVPFCTLGNISIDDLVFEDGSTMWCVPGGNSIYSALGMAVWQEKPAVIAPVGPEYPRHVVGERIDLSKCRPLERTLRNWGLYEEDGNRIFTFRTKTRNWLDFSPTLDDVDGLAIDFAHIAPLRWELQTGFAEALKGRGTRLISVDPDDRYLDQLQREPMLRLLHGIDLFLPSKQDVEALLPGQSLLDILKRLREWAPDLPLIAIKRGANGVMLHAAGEPDYFEMPTVAEAVVDTTGAGDAFSGGTLVGYARTGSPVEAVLWGSVSASYAVAAMGPAALVDAPIEQARARVERLRSQIEAHPL